MPRIRVLHMADMHLQWPFGSMGDALGDGHRGRLRREELKDVFVGIIDLVLNENVQVLLIAGDLFEHAHGTRALMKFLDSQFRRISNVPIFISPGNHDPLLPDSYYRTYPWAPNVHIFGPEGGRVDLPDLPVSVYGWGFNAYEVRECRTHLLQVEDATRINLAVLHGGDDVYHPCGPSDLAAMGADYIAMGHIHKKGPVFQQAGRVVARYSGSPEALGFGEPGEHGVYLGHVGKGWDDMAFVSTSRRRYHTVSVDVSGAESPEELVAAVLAAAEPSLRNRDCWRFILSGRVDAGLTVDLPVLQERLADSFYYLRLVDETQPDYDLERLSQERSARGLFVSRLLAMAAAEKDPTEKRRIQRALVLGLAAFEGKGGVA